MAKRGRPRKRGGLLIVDLAPRVSTVGSGDERDGRDLNEDTSRIVDEGHSGDKLLPDGLIEQWADEEEELIENLVVVDPLERLLVSDPMGEGWTPARKCSTGAIGQPRIPKDPLQCGDSGSMFRLLEETEDARNSSQRFDEIVAVVEKQLDDILAPFPPPTT
ncbi:hypothetical protein Dimus_019959 [Dionaea muscipula]